MTEPFIFIGTYTIKEGKLEDFKPYWREWVDFVEESEPRLIAFNAYVSDDGTEVGIVQVHPDVDSMEFHMKLIREHVEHAFAEPGPRHGRADLRGNQRLGPGDHATARGAGASDRETAWCGRLHPLRCGASARRVAASGRVSRRCRGRSTPGPRS